MLAGTVMPRLSGQRGSNTDRIFTPNTASDLKQMLTHLDTKVDKVDTKVDKVAISVKGAGMSV